MNFLDIFYYLSTTMAPFWGDYERILLRIILTSLTALVVLFSVCVGYRLVRFTLLGF